MWILNILRKKITDFENQFLIRLFYSPRRGSFNFKLTNLFVRTIKVINLLIYGPLVVKYIVLFGPQTKKWGHPCLNVTRNYPVFLRSECSWKYLFEVECTVPSGSSYYLSQEAFPNSHVLRYLLLVKITDFGKIAPRCFVDTDVSDESSGVISELEHTHETTQRHIL